MTTTTNNAMVQAILDASEFASKAASIAYEDSLNLAYLDELYEDGCDCDFEDVFGVENHIEFHSYCDNVAVYKAPHYITIANGCPVNGISFYMNNIVYIDEKLELSVNAREFLIFHEEGHIHHNHPSMMDCSYDRILSIHNNNVLPFVLEADEYAVDKLGKYMVYCALLELIAKVDDGYTKKELLMRAEIVSNM